MTTFANDDIDQIALQWKQLGIATDFHALEIVARTLRLAKALEAELAKLHSEFNLKQGEFDVLAALKRADGEALTPSQLYQTMLLSSGAMTSRLDRLENKQLIQRQHCQQDRRSIKVSLTATGKQLIDTVAAKHFERITRLFSPLDETDKTQLADLLRINLKQIEHLS